MSAPNFLFIMTDQHRADYLGCYGHPVLKTPNIDRIAAGGTRFDRCYVTTPICMPNRSSLMTGRMPSVHGVRCNGIPLDPDSNTFTHLLRAGGYRTALIGKSHLQNMTEWDAPLKRRPRNPEHLQPSGALQDAHRRGYFDERVEQENPSFWRRPDAAVRTPFYGFDHVEVVTMHGDMAGGEYLHWVRDQGADIERLRGAANALPHDYVCPQAWRTAVPEELYSTSYIRDRSLAYLDRHARWGSEQPFFLKVSFPDPHHPFTPPGRYWDMYSPEDMTLPASFHPAGDYKPSPAVRYCHDNADKADRQARMMFSVNEREAREAVALTCGMISMIDDGVGQLLDRLEQLGLAENTVVVFTSDHGDFLGDHQLLLKGPIHYQSLLRVPLLWRDTADRAAGAETAALASTMDIAATILDRAGVDPYHGMQGISLLPAMVGEKANDEVLVEEDGQWSVLGFDGPPRVRTLVTERYRMTLYHGAWGELYDLREDPHELYNLWDTQTAVSVKMELLERLARKQLDLIDRSPLPPALA